MLTLEEYVKENEIGQKKMIERSKDITQFTKGVPLELWFCEESFGIFEIDNMNIPKAKNHFYNCGLLDIYDVNRFNSLLLDYGVDNVCYAILSDNEDMILQYAKLRYKAYGKRFDMDEYVLQGESPLTCNTIQFFMENNNVGIERNLNIYEIKKDKILRRGKVLEYDYEFYKALYINDKSKMEGILEILVSPKIHKKRNDSPIFSQYISLPALGYAKLAWRKGIEVEVNSPLIPKELLPVQPLEKYEIPYEFLKEK